MNVLVYLSNTKTTMIMDKDYGTRCLREKDITRRFLLLPVYVVFAGLSFFLIRLIDDQHAWWRASLTMLWGTLVLISFLWMYLNPWPKLKDAGITAMTGIAAVLIVGFVIWLIALAARVVNLLAPLLGTDWHIRPLFHGIHNFVFSFPGLICAIIILYEMMAWSDDKYPWIIKK